MHISTQSAKNGVVAPLKTSVAHLKGQHYKKHQFNNKGDATVDQLCFLWFMNSSHENRHVDSSIPIISKQQLKIARPRHNRKLHQYVQNIEAIIAHNFDGNIPSFKQAIEVHNPRVASALTASEDFTLCPTKNLTIEIQQNKTTATYKSSASSIIFYIKTSKIIYPQN